ncbi:hypothetical protein UCRPC4_g02121 [Phaeomoniella chlamydospora]|uniref:Uncharacterized protein n=1 Tax=Phaeomoniella chlamydospora TaxID=158046 RepID=A0A0G2ES49_PHACM|nr:hypothetical protein UCRPC4_g02121 [Phaeomoniella chlamydospora]
MNSSYDECTGTDLGNPSLGGDHRTTKCLGKLEPTLNVTVWKELRQWDLRGHTAGLFESGKQIWTFHHWGKTGWFNQDVLPMVATAPIAGEASVLQRIRFGDSGGSIATKRSYYVLTNGFSIVKYDVEAGVKDVDFDETEYTWNDNPDDYEDYLGPFRKVNVEGVTKKRWRLDGAKRIGDNIHQMYKYDRDGEIDFIEIIWLSGH